MEREPAWRRAFSRLSSPIVCLVLRFGSSRLAHSPLCAHHQPLPRLWPQSSYLCPLCGRPCAWSVQNRAASRPKAHIRMQSPMFFLVCKSIN